MKRKLTVILALVFTLVSVAGCAAKPDKTAYDHGLELIGTMAEMANSPAYISMTTGSTEISEMLLPIQAKAANHPAAVYTITLNEEYLSIMEEWAQAPEISDSIKAAARQKLISAFAVQINALAGAQNLAASAICAASKTFVDEELTENVIYLYIFEGCPPAAVTFVPGEGGAVSASGTFILYDGVDFMDENALSDFFAEMGAELKAYGG